MNGTSSRVHALALGFSAVAILVLGGRFGYSLLMPPPTHVLASAKFMESRETRSSIGAANLISIVDQPEQIQMPTRNLFEEWQAPPMMEVRLVLKAIERRGPAIFYAGRMQDEDQSFFAQVNFEGRSYFLKQGEEVKAWKILEIHEDEIKVKNPKGDTVLLPYRGGSVKSKDMYAVLVREPDGKSYQLKEGEAAEGFVLKEIGERSIRLSKDGTDHTIRESDPGVLIDRVEWADEGGNDE